MFIFPNFWKWWPGHKIWELDYNKEEERCLGFGLSLCLMRVQIKKLPGHEIRALDSGVERGWFGVRLLPRVPPLWANNRQTFRYNPLRSTFILSQNGETFAAEAEFLWRPSNVVWPSKYPHRNSFTRRSAYLVLGIMNGIQPIPEGHCATNERERMNVVSCKWCSSFKHCQRHFGPRCWLLWPVVLVW